MPEGIGEVLFDEYYTRLLLDYCIDGRVNRCILKSSMGANYSIVDGPPAGVGKVLDSTPSTVAIVAAVLARFCVVSLSVCLLV